MITRNTEIDDVEFQRSEIISDLWKDLADNERSGEFIIHDRGIYEIYDPLNDESYFIVPTVRGRWLKIKIDPLTMWRDYASILTSIQHNYSSIMLSHHISKCESVAKQYFQDINENTGASDRYNISEFKRSVII